MNEKQRKRKLAAWIASRPPEIQKLAAEFPIGTLIEIPAGQFKVMGWTESDHLIVHPLACETFEEASHQRRYICAKHFRGTPDANDGTNPR